MKHIKTINLVTGETKSTPIGEYFMNSIQAEIRNLMHTIQIYPDIGTVKDGSKFATLKILESIERKAINLSDKNMIFTTFYKDVLSDIRAIEEIYNNTADVSAKCILIGQRIGYLIAKNLIEDLNNAAPVENNSDLY